MAEFVYTLTNSWFPGLTKLGTTTDIDRRLSQLSSVLPGKSVLVWYQEVDNGLETESAVRKILSKFAIDNSRDWFACPVNVVIDQFLIYLENETSQSILDGLPVGNTIEVKSLADLGEYCRRWRKYAGFTLKEFAGFCNVGVRFVSELERGKSTCQFDLCIKVAQTLGIDLFAVKRD
jgi:HTH-type transcriptional regulator/antitoxin HipB